MLMTGTTLFTSLFLAYIVELLSAWSYDGLKGYHRNPEGFGLRVGLWLNKHICRPKWAWFSDPFDFCKGVWKTYKYGHDAFTDMPTWEKYQGALSGKDDTAVRSMQSLENLFVDRLKMLNDKVKGKEQRITHPLITQPTKRLTYSRGHCQHEDYQDPAGKFKHPAHDNQGIREKNWDNEARYNLPPHNFIN